MLFRLALGLTFLSQLSVCAPAPESWALAKSANFEVYSQSGPASARAALQWLEQVRALFVSQAGLDPARRRPVRVIGFASRKQFDSYRAGAAADAYYIGTESRDYIVLPSLAPDHFRVAVHEYAHALMHAAGYRPPRWLNEGLAEVISTVRFTESATLVGAEVPEHRRTLRARPWIPLPDLLAPNAADVPSSTLFYAQAWALTHMLLLAPRYADGFPDLTAKLLAGTPGPAALSAVYRKPIETIARDARAWSDRHSFDPVRLPVVSGAAHAAVVEQLSSVESRLILADLLALSGALDRAGALYRDLEREAPDSAAVAAGRGAIALRLSRAQEATRYFQRAVELGIADAAVCYQFALLADSAGLSQTVIRSALQRALDLDPAFDDAHYRLALLDANAERHESAVAHLKAMKIVRRDRAHAYWTTMADALIGLDRRDEAIEASRYAASHATTEDERSHAKQLAYVAQTDLAVRFTRDASGKLQLSTTRVPHDSVDRNPFVEAADQIRKVQARLVNVECGAGILTVSVETSEGQLRLAIPDPSHVQLRNGPSEFTCGPQPANPISVVYAVSRQSESNIDGVVRGIDF